MSKLGLWWYSESHYLNWDTKSMESHHNSKQIFNPDKTKVQWKKYPRWKSSTAVEMLTVGSVPDHKFVCLDKQLLPVKTRQKSSALTDWSWPLSVTLSEKKWQDVIE